MLFLWHGSVDIGKMSLFPNFQLILRLRVWVHARFTVSYCCIGRYFGNYYVDIINRQIDWFRQTNECARNILHTNIMYLKATVDVKHSTFLEKNGGMRLWITKWTFNLTSIGLQQKQKFWHNKVDLSIFKFLMPGHHTLQTVFNGEV